MIEKDSVVKLNHETKRKLVKLQGRLQAVTGRKQSLSKVIEYLLETENYAKTIK